MGSESNAAPARDEEQDLLNEAQPASRKGRQGIQADMCRIRPATGATNDPIKHPYGDFRKSVRPAASKIAPKHGITGLIDLLMDINRLAKPGVPSIKNVAALDNVGVLACSCTPSSALTPLSTSDPLTMLSSTRNGPGRPHETNRITSQLSRETVRLTGFTSPHSRSRAPETLGGPSGLAEYQSGDARSCVPRHRWCPARRCGWHWRWDRPRLPPVQRRS